MENTAVAKRPAGPVDIIRSHIESPAFLEQVKMAMPRGEDGRRLIRGAITQMQKNPKVAECTQPSIFSSLLTCGQMGLHLDGREAHLVPFWNPKANGGQGAFECQLIPDYKGLVRLILQSGLVSHIHASEVCENDEFDYDRGVVVRHKINFRKPRGDVYCFYAFARFKDGGEKAEAMGLEDVQRIRARSKQKDSGMWANDFNEAGKKTVTKRLSKWLPLSAEAQEAIEQDSVDFDQDSNVIVSAPPPVTPRRRAIPEQAPADPPPPVETAPPQVEPPAPPVKPGPRRRAAAATATVDVPPTAPAPTEPTIPLVEWLNKNHIMLGEVAQALVEYGCSAEGRQTEIKTLHDITEDEAKFILDQGDAIAAAIIGARAG